MKDAWQIHGHLRGLKGLQDESEISTPELMWYINLAYRSLLSAFWSQVQHVYSKQSILTNLDSDDEIYVPNDLESGLKVFRETTTPAGFRLATSVDSHLASLIDTSPNYAAAEAMPFYWIDGNIIRLYPALPASPDFMDVKLHYFRKAAHLSFGFTITTDPVDDEELELDKTAPVFDDAYAGHSIVLYEKDASFGYWSQKYVLKCTGYTPGSKLAEFLDNSTELSGLTAATKYMYSVVPALPDNYHQFIIDQTIILLISEGKFAGDLKAAMELLNQKVSFYGGKLNG